MLADGTPFATEVERETFRWRKLTLETTELPAIVPFDLSVRESVVPPTSLRSGQRLIVDGVVTPGFVAGPGSELLVASGGQVQRNMRAIGASVTVNGGHIEEGMIAFDGSTIGVFGGTVESLLIEDGANATLAGGAVGNLIADCDECEIEFWGTEFLWNGSTVSNTSEFMSRDGILTVEFADGQSREFSVFSGRDHHDRFSESAEIRLNLVESLCDVVALQQISIEDFFATSDLVGGDFNKDGAVSFADFLILTDGFGEAATYEQGDYDCNGTTEFADFLGFAGNFGTASLAAVPEPRTDTLGIFALAVLALRRRSHDNS